MLGVRCPGCGGFHVDSAALRECVASGGHSRTTSPQSGTDRTSKVVTAGPLAVQTGPPDPERGDGQVWLLGWGCVCGWQWISQTDARPARCPHCKTRRWAEDHADAS